MKISELAKIIEAVTFVSGDGIDLKIFETKYEVTEKEIKDAIEFLKNKYNNDSGINVVVYKNKLQFCSNPELVEDISEILNPIREKALTRAVLETVAIIAYKQPITRLEIENIRQVNNCDYAMQLLLKNNLIEVVGRKDTIGKPLLYGTTENFLKRFQVEDLSALPSYNDLLDRIQVIHSKDDSMFKTYDVPDDVIELDESEMHRERENFEEKFSNYADVISQSQQMDKIIKQTLTEQQKQIVDGEESPENPQVV